MSATSKLLVSIQTALSDARTATTIGAGTASGFSFAQVMGWLQSNVGFIGAILGIILTIVTIWVQLTKGRLEIELLKRQLGQDEQ